MAWSGEVRNVSGDFTPGYPGRGPANNPPDGITDWNDPAIPDLESCQHACGGSGFFSGDDAKDATRWDGLMLYLGKLRGLKTSDIWRQILLNDTILITWLQRDDVKNALTALLYAECIGPVPPNENYIQLCARAQAIALSGQPNSVEAMSVVFICEFFDKANTDPSFIKKTIYRSLSNTTDTEQCKKAGKVWPGNAAKCWLCNQNITNIYMGGLSYNFPTIVKIKGVDMVINSAVGGQLGVDTDETNPILSGRSIHNKECEHCLPYIVGAYILKLYGGNPKLAIPAAKKQAANQGKSVQQVLAENSANINTALKWQDLEYEWSHSYCNQIKSQGHFLDYDEQTGKFGIDYVQVANFSKRLRCQGNYKAEEYDDTQKECRKTTDKGKLRELTWKNFTDETEEILYSDSNKNELTRRNIRTVCNPNGESCRKSFISPSEIPGIGSPNHEANVYLEAKAYPIEHIWMKDTDGIINKMTLIVDALNSPANDPTAPITNLSIGLLSLIRARISSFIIAKYLEDVSKQLSLQKTATVTAIWGTSLPNPWTIEDGYKYAPTGGDTQGIAAKFVFGLARCCEAAIKSNRIKPIDFNTPVSSIELQSWLDGCIHSSNAAYMSLSRIEKLKGDETSFGRVRTRAYKKAAILMANPVFVIPLLTLLNNLLQKEGTPFVSSGTGYQLKADWQTTIVNFGMAVVNTIRGTNIIYTQMEDIAESIIPTITTGAQTYSGREYNSQWQNVARVITEQIQNFIPNLYYYSNPIALFSDAEIARFSSYDSNAYARDAFNGYSAAANKIDWLEDIDALEFMLESDDSVINPFWLSIFTDFEGFLTNIQTSGGFDRNEAILYISNYLKEYVNNEDILDGFLSRVGGLDQKTQVRRQSARLRGLLPEYSGLFGKVKSRAKPKGKPRAKPKRKSSDTNLKNKLKMVGIKVTKMVKGKRVSLTKKELQKRISAFKKLQTKAKKLKVSLKYKSTSGRYKFKSRKRLISDIKKARKNTKRKNKKNTKRKNTKRNNKKRNN